MKKILVILLCVVLMLGALASCATDTPPADSGTEAGTPADTPAESGTVTEGDTTPALPTLDPATLSADKTYDNDHGAVLSSYAGKTAEDYQLVCNYYIADGWEIYCQNDMNGNLFTTFVNGEKLAHVYLIPTEGDLNIVRSDTEGGTLPPKDGGAVGTEVTSITQLQQSGETSGLAYVIRLSDGSFIIYDGGYVATIRQLLDELQAQNGPGEVHIRAWIMSHGHDDHYSCFQALTRRLKSHLSKYEITLKLDHFIMAPASNADTAEDNFLGEGVYDCLEAFPEAEIAYAHTGMTFRFSNMALDILHTAEELYIDGNPNYFNETSIISRLYSTRPEQGETLSMIFLGDAGAEVAAHLMQYYGETLKSDMCQISHHGVENFPLAAYELIAAPTLFYPCSNALYALTDRDADVRAALRESEVTKEILLRQNDKYTRYFDPAKNPEPIGKPDATGKLG